MGIETPSRFGRHERQRSEDCVAAAKWDDDERAQAERLDETKMLIILRDPRDHFFGHIGNELASAGADDDARAEL